MQKISAFQIYKETFDKHIEDSGDNLAELAYHFDHVIAAIKGDIEEGTLTERHVRSIRSMFKGLCTRFGFNAMWFAGNVVGKQIDDYRNFLIQKGVIKQWK